MANTNKETGLGFYDPLFFIGVVENNNDPRLEGRVQVRAFGIHGTISDIPTEDLPWATLIIGSHDTNFVVPPINAWVLGFFIDGRDAQQPMVLGLIPTQMTEIVDPSVTGWGAPLGAYEDRAAMSRRHQDFGQPTLPRTARGEYLDETYNLPLETNRTRNVEIAGGCANNLGSMGNMNAYTPDSLEASGGAPSPGYPSDMDQSEIETIIAEEARLRNMDPNVAIRIFRAEGAGSYQSSVPRSGSGSLNGREASFGPYQLFIGDGMGNDYQNRTCRNLVSDNTRDGITNQIRFALDQAVVQGWRPWYGRGPAGVGIRDGLSGATQANNWAPCGEGVTPNEETQTNETTEDMTEQPTYETAPECQQAWDEPESGYNARYPFNRSVETPGGHVFELDSTQGAERFMLWHPNGSYIQITPSTVTHKSTVDKFEVNDQNYHVHIGGRNIITVEGDSHFLVNGNRVDEVRGDYQLIVHGNYHAGAAGQLAINGGEEAQIRAGRLDLESNVEHLNLRVSRKINITSGGEMHLKSNSLNIESAEDTHFKIGGDGHLDATGKLHVYGDEVLLTGGTSIDIKTETGKIETTGQFDLKTATMLLESSGESNLKGSHVKIGGGSQVSLNAALVALDDLVELASGSSVAPDSATGAAIAAMADGAEAASQVEMETPPDRDAGLQSAVNDTDITPEEGGNVEVEIEPIFPASDVELGEDDILLSEYLGMSEGRGDPDDISTTGTARVGNEIVNFQLGEPYGNDSRYIVTGIYNDYFEISDDFNNTYRIGRTEWTN